MNYSNGDVYEGNWVNDFKIGLMISKVVKEKVQFYY